MTTTTEAPSAPEDVLAEAQQRGGKLRAQRDEQAAALADLATRVDAAVLDGTGTTKLMGQRRDVEDTIGALDRAITADTNRAERARREIEVRDRRKRLDDARTGLAACRTEITDMDANGSAALDDAIAGVVRALDVICLRAERRQELCRQLEAHAKTIADTAPGCGEEPETVRVAGFSGATSRTEVMSAEQIISEPWHANRRQTTPPVTDPRIVSINGGAQRGIGPTAVSVADYIATEVGNGRGPHRWRDLQDRARQPQQ